MDEIDDLASCRVERTERRKKKPAKRPKNLRPVLWVISPTAFLVALMGLFGLSSEQRVIVQTQDEVNQSLESRMSYGSGATVIVSAAVDFSYGSFAYSAMSKGPTSLYRADVIAQPVYRDCAVIARNPETTVTKSTDHTLTRGDAWAEEVPEEVSLLKGVVRAVVSPVDTWEDRQTLNKTRLLANELPVVALASGDCDFVEEGSVESIQIRAGSIEIAASRWSLGWRAMSFFTAFLLSGLMMAALWLNRDFAKG